MKLLDDEQRRKRGKTVKRDSLDNENHTEKPRLMSFSFINHFLFPIQTAGWEPFFPSDSLVGGGATQRPDLSSVRHLRDEGELAESQTSSPGYLTHAPASAVAADPG